MLLCVYYVDDSLTDGVVVLRPTGHKIGHFGDVGQKDDSYIRDERRCSGVGGTCGAAVELNIRRGFSPTDLAKMPHPTTPQTCIPPGSLNRVPASAGVRAGMSPLPGGR